MFKKIKEITLFKIIISIILALFSIIAMSVNGEIAAQLDLKAVSIKHVFLVLCAELSPSDIGTMIAGFLLIYLFWKYLFNEKHPFSRTAFIISIIFAIFMILGISFFYYDSFDFIVGGPIARCVCLFTFIGFVSIFYVLLKMFYEYADSDRKVEHTDINESKIIKFASKNYTKFCYIFLLIAWIIPGIFYFPGNVPHDARYQLNMIFHAGYFNLHHPLLSTLIMGLIYKLGYKIGGCMLGAALYVIFQSLIGAFVFTKICNYIKEKTGNIRYSLYALCFYAFAPMFWTYMGTVMKDTLYFVLFSWFILDYYRLIHDEISKKEKIALLILAPILCLLKNGAVFIIVPAFIILLVIKKEKKFIVLGLCIVIAINASSSFYLKNVRGMSSDNPLEGICVPVQQVARYVKTYKSEITEDEATIINNVVEYKDIEKRYTPDIADPVKDAYTKATKEDLGEFFKLYKTYFKKHPEVFVESFVAGSYGYIYPFYYRDSINRYQLYIKEPFGKNDKDMIYSRYVFNDSIRNNIRSILAYINVMPVLSLFVSCATYVWLGIIYLGLLLKRKNFKIALTFMVPMLCVAMCMVSPVNGYLRYMLPVMATIPLFILEGGNKNENL